MSRPHLSAEQNQILCHAVGDKKLAIATGSIRSGKTTAQHLGFALWAARKGVGYDHALIARNRESAMRNVGFDLIKSFAELGIKSWITNSLGSRIVFRYGGRDNNIWIFGAMDSRSVQRIQGCTLKGLLIDELTNIGFDMWNMALSRMSVRGSKVWATTNPDGPNHWVKKQVIDKLHELNGYQVHCKLENNPGISQEEKDWYRSSFSGVFYKRYIEGLWAGAAGVIYPTWYSSDVQIDKDVKPVISLDFAIASTFAALMFKPHGSGTVAMSEYAYDAKENGYQRTETEHADAIMEWIDINYSGKPTGIQVYMDPATPVSFKRLLRKYGLRTRKADNTVLSGIVTTGTRLDNRNILIGDCPLLKDELDTYSWDPKAQERGDDEPIKQYDHACDALRYFAHTTGKYQRMRKQPTVSEVMNYGT